MRLGSRAVNIVRLGPRFLPKRPLRHIAFLPSSHVFFRTKWLGFLQKQPVLIEEPENSDIPDNRANQIKHLLRSTDTSDEDKRKLIQTEIREFLQNELKETDLSIINSMFMLLYKLNHYDAALLPAEELKDLLVKSANVLLSQDRFVLPEYLSILIQHLLKAKISLDASILVPVTLLATRLGGHTFNLKETILLLIKSGREIDNAYISALIDYLSVNQTLNMRVFETIAEACLENSIVIDDQFYKDFVQYIEKLYEKSTPQTHEYKDLEKNIFRVQESVNVVMLNMKYQDVLLDTLLSMLYVINELVAVNHHEVLELLRKEALEYLNSCDEKQVTSVFLRQESGEESLLDSMLDLLFKEGYSKLSTSVFREIINNPMFFSNERVIQAKLYLEVLGSEQEMYEKVLKFLEDVEDVDVTKLYCNIVQAFITSQKVTPNGPFFKQINSKFSEEIEIPLLGYQHAINSAIKTNEYQVAIDLFNDSLSTFSQWSDDSDPKALRVLNDLVIASCRKFDDIQDVFVLFTKIKQHMANDKINVYAITELAQRMLSVEYVGDCIEMLKRELPEIDKEATVKLPLNESFGFAYKNLFNVLHEFVTNYTNEESFETNWVLYGELHKYFHVPFESYLPAMKFFCEHDRLNASLIILRQVRKLYETHGNHNHLPPLKEMYMYLFQEFGDKLYQEGVEEVHEYLKMDVSLPKQDLELQNCILNAYSNLQEVGKTRDLFLAMHPMKRIDGKTTIDEKTAQIMLKTYTYSDLNYVKSFWNNLSTFGIYPNYDIFRQYLIAHVYHGFPDQAIELTKEMDDFGLEVKPDTLVALYNFCLGSEDQNQIEKWASIEHPKLWQEVNDKKLLQRSDDYMPETSMLVEGGTSVAKI